MASTATAVPSGSTPANSCPAIWVLPNRRYIRSDAQIPVPATRTSSPSPSGSSMSTTRTSGGTFRTARIRLGRRADESFLRDQHEGPAVVHEALRVLPDEALALLGVEHAGLDLGRTSEVQLPDAVVVRRGVGQAFAHVVLHVVPEARLVRQRQRPVPFAPVLA